MKNYYTPANIEKFTNALNDHRARINNGEMLRVSISGGNSNKLH